MPAMKQINLLFVALSLVFAPGCSDDTDGGDATEAAQKIAEEAGKTVGESIGEDEKNDVKSAIQSLAASPVCGVTCKYLIEPLAGVLISTGSDIACELAANTFFAALSVACEECVPEEVELEAPIAVICGAVGDGVSDLTKEQAADKLASAVGCDC